MTDSQGTSRLIAVVDNATVSSVLRALGFAPAEESTLEVDQAALEKFCEAVLLSDETVVPDSYKEDLRAKRARLLESECIRAVQISPDQDKELIQASDELSQVWFEAFEANSESGTFRQYFRQANAFAEFIWEHASSEFFLVFRALGVNKASPLIDAFLASRADTDLAERVVIRGTDGKPVERAHMAVHVQRLVAILAWLGSRYVWHQVFAAQVGGFYMPHPLREFFAFDFMSRLGAKELAAPGPLGHVLRPIQGFRTKLRDQIEAAGFGDADARVPIPALIPVVLANAADDGRSFLAELFRLRDMRRVVELRQVLGLVARGVAVGDLSEAVKLAQHTEQIGKALLKECKIVGPQLTLKPPTSVCEVEFDGAEVGVNIGVPANLFKQYFIHKKYRVFIKSVMEEIAYVSKLGGFKTQLNALARVESRKYPAFYSKSVSFGRYARKFGKSTRPA